MREQSIRTMLENPDNKSTVTIGQHVYFLRRDSGDGCLEGIIKEFSGNILSIIPIRELATDFDTKIGQIAKTYTSSAYIVKVMDRA